MEQGDVRKLEALGAQEIAAALEAAVDDGRAVVTAVPELCGASVKLCCVEVCVNVDLAAPGINVESWHRYAGDPFRCTLVATLDEAIGLMLTEFEDAI